MAHLDLIEAFDDCVQQLAAGESLERCLSRYPTLADQLRPMLETVISLRRLQIPQAEVYEDKAIVWEQLQRQIQTQGRQPARRMRTPVQLLVAVLILLLMLSISLFVLSRLDLPIDTSVASPIPLTETLSPSPSPSPSATPSSTTSPTVTADPTETPSPTLSATSTASPTPTTTPTPSPSQTLSPTATSAQGCGAPLSAEAASERVLEIYPNTTVLSVTQTEKFGGTLVWEVRTSHQIVVTIDVACGNILTIEQAGLNTATPAASGGANLNDNAASGSANTNENSNDSSGDDDENEDGGSGMGSDD